MKVFLLDADTAFTTEIEEYLNSCRAKMNFKKAIREEELLMDDAIASYTLFVLNLKNPEDPHVLKFLRKHGSIAPVLLMLDANTPRNNYKTLYYLGYDDIITKPFIPEEIAFHIYKLCGLWNNESFFISKDTYFDSQNNRFVHYEDEILLGKKEALLLKYLFIKSQHIVSHNEIACYVYEDEIVSEERIRSLVRQLRAKIPLNLIESVKGEGYKISLKAVS